MLPEDRGKDDETGRPTRRNSVYEKLRERKLDNNQAETLETVSSRSAIERKIWCTERQEDQIEYLQRDDAVQTADD